MPSDFISELSWRGLFHQATNEAELRNHLSSGSRLLYAGFDPTADSLTIGNLVPIMLLRHAQKAGHIPVVVMGGGTGLIGDPSGKSGERPLLNVDQVNHNIHRQRQIFDRMLDFTDSKNPARIVNNADWLSQLSYLEVLRDVGKLFSVNAMIQRDSVKDRLQGREQGISYTEFSYMVLQAYDFYHLHKTHHVTVQMGGSDQYGNILSGCDLIHRLTSNQPAFGLTAPLLTKADGGKFGKTESGAIWLTADRTSPYALYQFFLNADDRDVIKFLKFFTFLSREQVTALEEQHKQNPGGKVAHRTLAQEATDLIHGIQARKQAEAASQALFSGDISSLNQATLEDLFANVPGSQHPRSLLQDQGSSVVDVLMLTSLVKSKREAREHLAAGAILLNGKVAQPEEKIFAKHLLYESLLVLRRGRKYWYVLRFV